MPLIAEIVPPEPDDRTLADLPPGTLCEVDYCGLLGVLRYRDNCGDIWEAVGNLQSRCGNQPLEYKVRRIIGYLKFTRKDGKLTVEIVPFDEPQRTLADLEPWEWASCNHPTVGRVLRCRDAHNRILKRSSQGFPIDVGASSPSQYTVDRVEGQLRLTVEGEQKGSDDG